MRQVDHERIVGGMPIVSVAVQLAGRGQTGGAGTDDHDLRGFSAHVSS